jgi:pyruvate,water dikinase
MKTILYPLNSPDPSLELLGGKALNLSKLAQAGLPVPDGFFIPTTYYNALTQKHDLASVVKKQLANLEDLSPTQLAKRAEKIRAHFHRDWITEDFHKEFISAWEDLSGAPVAVRSSATAEDLPGMSFAGQQDTFLNITNADALLEAILSCWASLWTARAIQYRHRNSIPQDAVALCVIVQNMVQAESSGVLFTANPLTGLRSEMVVDATFGYGEALVSGQVEPDHFVIDRKTNQITERNLGAKALVMRAAKKGGVGEDKADRSSEQSITDEHILHLSTMAEDIEALYDFPQDVEWALAPSAAGLPVQLFILQSRPITSLYPLPATNPDDDLLHFYFSFALVQGLLDPFTPLGRDAIRFIFAGSARLFGLEHTHHTQPIIREAGERLWGDITSVIRHPVGRRIVPRAFSVIDPGSSQSLEEIMLDDTLAVGQGRWKFSSFARMLKFMRTLVPKMLKAFRHPEGTAKRIHQEFTHYLAELEAAQAPKDDNPPTLREAVDYFYKMRLSFQYAVPEIFSAAVAGLIPMAILGRLANELSESPDLILQASRGLPNNITTEMDLNLWQTAYQLQQDPSSRKHFESKSAEDLAQRYLEGKLPATAQELIAAFMEKFGMRAVGEIDIGKARWREDPRQIMQTLQSYLKIDDPSKAPDAVFKRGEEAAEEVLLKLEKAARNSFAGPLRARLVRSLSRRFRNLAGLRESPKFFIINLMGQIRAALLAAGETLVAEGKLDRADDLFFLSFDQLEEFAELPGIDARSLVNEARHASQREALRTQIPRLMLSDGRTFYEGIASAEGAEGELQGSPVSPGTVEGRVHVLFDPHSAHLEPGEILVCPGTDPAWTPLFLAAGGLVMEVGGMMTHGAIVAREYGIPAVVGVDRATQRLQTGDLVRVDGSTGLVQIIDGEN